MFFGVVFLAGAVCFGFSCPWFGWLLCTSVHYTERFDSDCVWAGYDNVTMWLKGRGALAN